ncbi:MAG: cation:proton antiporter [Nanoarchaeota archaeon]|nr:cation:proton antiporter [Nanoarchaeota archaeon]
MQTFLVLISLIIISYLFTYLLRKLKISKVVSLILLGLIFGSTNFGIFFIQGAQETILILGHVGLLSLMFLAGLESSYKTLIEEEHDAFELSIFNFAITLALSFFVFFMLGFSFIESIIIGLCLCVSSEGSKAREFIELNLIKTKVASALLAGGFIVNIFTLVCFFVILFFSGFNEYFEYLLLAGILISFIVGLTTQHFFLEHHITKKTEFLLANFFVPFFFISLGLNFTFDSLKSDIFLFAVILLVGISSKFIGTFLAKSHTTFSNKQLHLISWGMNSRGAIGIALALVALHANLISELLFSILVITALITTLLFPFILEFFIKRNPKIMN